MATKEEEQLKFNSPFLLLCEGQGDVGFYKKLLPRHGLQNKFCIHRPQCPGRGGFRAFLNGAHANEEFVQNVKGVLIVSDSDDNPAESLIEITNHLKRISGFPVPKTAKAVAKAKGFPPVVILLVPIDRQGNLETLCVEAAEAKWALRGKVDTYLAGTPANGWGYGKQSKMRMQCIIAGTCEDQPDIALASHWRQKEQFHVPVDHACFDSIAQFLTGFEALITAP